ncbi:peptidase M23B [Magnetococcus marinus MC-1]|uniref:Peptidase M23B n=1 Tax=Magnetococcus marinus (strain ATCC BAA-1437 / JCM 17883 / MC-1) TaxID=156889 RepID=A0LDF2_MAGMM|nr:peptidase M23B [Magnetococcus marinus MC-1]
MLDPVGRLSGHRAWLVGWVLLGVVLWSGAVWAQDASAGLSAKQAKLDGIIQQLKQEQLALDKAKGQERSLLSELESMERRLTDGEQRLAEIQQEVQRIRLTLPALAARIDSRTMAMARQQQLLAGHLRLFYGMEGKEALRILSPQRHAKATMQNMVYFRYLIEARNARFMQYKKSVEALQEASAAQQTALASLHQLANKELALRGDLQQHRTQRSELLDQVRQERNLHARKVVELKEAHERLSQFMGKLSRAIDSAPPEQPPRSRRVESRTPTFKKIVQVKGRLPDPVAGSAEEFEPGLFYDVPKGSMVRAIHRAQVVYADWFRGYGQLLILNHGENVYSLYGHNDRLLVAQGDWVEAGDAMAEVGNSGALDGRVGLYFEIRQNGRTENAHRWLAAK